MNTTTITAASCSNCGTTLAEDGSIDVARLAEAASQRRQTFAIREDRAQVEALTLDWLEDEGNPLNQTQRVQFVECVLRCMDGLERGALETLMESFGKIERSDDAR